MSTTMFVMGLRRPPASGEASYQRVRPLGSPNTLTCRRGDANAVCLTKSRCDRTLRYRPAVRVGPMVETMTLSPGNDHVRHHRPDPLAEWWAAQIGGTIVEENEGWFVTVAGGKGTPMLGFQRWTTRRRAKPVHLDLVAADPRGRGVAAPGRRRDAGGAPGDAGIPVDDTRRSRRQRVLRGRQSLTV